MSVLLRVVHRSHLRREPLQALLPLCGVAIGVAAIVAIGLGSGSTIASFEWTMQRLEGRATDQLLPGTGPLGPALAYRIGDLPGVSAAAPVLERLVLAEEALTLYGVDSFAESELRDLGLSRTSGGGSFFRDFLARPGALAVSEPYLERHGLTAGDSLTISVGSRLRRAFVLAALPREIDGLRVPDNLAVCDIATAQELTGAEGLSRIDLLVEAEQRSQALAAIAALAPADAQLARPGGRATHMRNMLDALRSNLRALSYLSLFVALFLIYNAMSLAALRRRGEMGILRSLGATPREMQRAWLLEGLVLGICGSALGIALGVAGGHWVMRGFARSAGDLYGQFGETMLRADPRLLLQALTVGVTTSVVGSWIPARQAAGVPPARAGMRAELEAGTARGLRALWIGAGAALVVASGALLLPTRASWPGYVAAIALAGAASLLAPYVAEAALERVRPLAARAFGLLPALAIDNIRRSLSRTGLAIAALCVALSMSIAMGTMVESFRREMQDWIANTVRADVYVSTPSSQIDFDDARIGGEIAAALRQLPQVVAVDSYRGGEIRIGELTCPIGAVEVDVLRLRARPQLLRGPAPDRYFDDLRAGQAGISESLWRKVGLSVGDTLSFELRGQAMRLRIAGVVRDYSSDRGFVLVDRSLWERRFGQEDPNSLALYLREDSDVESFVEAAKQRFQGEHALVIRSQRALREDAREVFDRTFSVAEALEKMGIAVAAIGVLSALLALILERGRELATLRALGMTPSQLAAMLAMESGWIALLSWLIALPAGAALAWILLGVIQERSFGWSLSLRAPAGSWTENLLLALLAAGLATLPALVRARRLSIAAALRRE